MWFVLFHVGAGYFEESEIEASKMVLSVALHDTTKRLRTADQLTSDGNTAIDGSSTDDIAPAQLLCRGVAMLEDSSVTNAGLGSNLTMMETVECDAGISDSRGNYGAVACVERIKNAVNAAFEVYRFGKANSNGVFIPPLILSGRGAEDFFTKQGGTLVNPLSLLTADARRRYRKALSKMNRHNEPQPSVDVSQSDERAKNPTTGYCSESDAGVRPEKPNDTIGGMLIFRSFAVAASSSGGPLLKLPGRVGPAAHVGACMWCCRSADGSVLSVLCSGSGESMILTGLARVIAETLAYDWDVSKTLTVFEESFVGKVSHRHAFAGVVAAKSGDKRVVEVLYLHNTSQFIFAYQTPTMKRCEVIVSDGKCGDVVTQGAFVVKL